MSIHFSDIGISIDDSGNITIPSSLTVSSALTASDSISISPTSSGVTADSGADQLLIETSSNAGLTIGSGTSGTGTIAFGDSGDANAGQIQYNHSTNHMGIYTAGSEVLTITDDGLVGINSTSPAGELHIVAASGDANLRIETNDATQGFTEIKMYGRRSSADKIGVLGYNRIADTYGFCYDTGLNSTLGIQINSSGSVGIGTTSPDELLEIAGGDLEISSISSGTGTAVVVDANGKILKDSSSERYKANIQSIDLPTDVLSQLRVVEYDRKIFDTVVEKLGEGEDAEVIYKKVEREGEYQSHEIGLIAEEVFELSPELVVLDTEGRPDSVRYDRLCLYLLQALQDKGVL